MEAFAEIDAILDSLQARIIEDEETLTAQGCSNELCRIREMIQRHQPITNLVNLGHPAYDRVIRKIAILAFHFRSHNEQEVWPVGDAMWRDRYGYDITVGFEPPTDQRYYQTYVAEDGTTQFVVSISDMLELVQPDAEHRKKGWGIRSYFWTSSRNTKFRKDLDLATDCLDQTNPAVIAESREILINELLR